MTTISPLTLLSGCLLSAIALSQPRLTLLFLLLGQASAATWWEQLLPLLTAFGINCNLALPRFSAFFFSPLFSSSPQLSFKTTYKQWHGSSSSLVISYQALILSSLSSCLDPLASSMPLSSPSVFISIASYSCLSSQQLFGLTCCLLPNLQPPRQLCPPPP